MALKMSMANDHDHREHHLHLDGTGAEAGTAPRTTMNLSVVQDLLGPVTFRTSR